MTTNEFKEFIYKNLTEEEKSYFMYTPPTNAQVGLDILIKHFLGDDWYCTGSINNEQVNTEAIYEILQKYPRKKSIFKRIKNIFHK